MTQIARASNDKLLSVASQHTLTLCFHNCRRCLSTLASSHTSAPCADRSSRLARFCRRLVEPRRASTDLLRCLHTGGPCNQALSLVFLDAVATLSPLTRALSGDLYVSYSITVDGGTCRARSRTRLPSAQAGRSFLL